MQLQKHLLAWLLAFTALRAQAQLSLPVNILVGRDVDSLPITYQGLGSTNTPIPNLRFSTRFAFNPQAERWKIAATTGIAVSWTKLRFDRNNLTFNANSANYVRFGTDTTATRDYSNGKSKLVAAYVQVPLMLSFIYKNTFFVSAGAEVGILIGGKHKRVFETNGERDKEVERFRSNRGFGLNPFQVSARVEFGIKEVYFFGTYNFLNFFRKEVGLQMNLLTVGVGTDITGIFQKKQN